MWQRIFKIHSYSYPVREVILHKRIRLQTNHIHKTVSRAFIYGDGIVMKNYENKELKGKDRAYDSFNH